MLFFFLLRLKRIYIYAYAPLHKKRAKVQFFFEKLKLFRKNVQKKRYFAKYR